VGLNPWANPVTIGFGRIGLKFLEKCQYGSIFDPTHKEPGSFGLKLWWAELVYQPVWSHTLCWALQCWVVFLTKHI